MIGVQAYDCHGFHTTCPDSELAILDIAGRPWLWCRHCRVLANLEAISPKFQSYDDCKLRRSEVNDGSR